MLGLAGVLALAAGAAEVSVKVLPASPCVAQAPLVRRLRDSGLSVTERPSRQTLMVTLSGEARLLVVRAKRAELAFERRIPASLSDCAAVERVTVALITAWAASSTLAVGDAGTPVESEARPVRVEASDVTPPLRAQRAEPVEPPPPEPEPDAGVPEAIDAGALVLPEFLDAGAAPPPLPDAGAIQSAPLRLEVAVLGGVSGGPTPVATAAGSVLAGFSSGRWGVLIEAGLESERAQRLPPVRVSAVMQWLSVSFRVAFELLESLTLDFALGARGWRISAQATGVDVATDANELSAGPALSAGLSWRVAGPVFIHVRPFVALRFAQLSFSVNPLGEVLLLGPWSAGATLGALFRFE